MWYHHSFMTSIRHCTSGVWWLWRPMECNEPIVIEAVWGDLSFVKCIWSYRHGHSRQIFSGRLCAFRKKKEKKSGTKYAKKTSNAPMDHQEAVELLPYGRTDPWFHVVYPKLWADHLIVAGEIMTQFTRQCFSNCVLFKHGELCTLASFPLTVANRNCMQCGLSLPKPSHFKVWTCWAFRNARQHTSLVMSSYCCSALILNQFGHSPLTSGINKAFHPTQRLLNHRDGCTRK